MLNRSDNVGEFVVDGGRLDGEAEQARERAARFLVVAFEDEPPRRLGEGKETDAEDGSPDKLLECCAECVNGLFDAAEKGRGFAETRACVNCPKGGWKFTYLNTDGNLIARRVVIVFGSVDDDGGDQETDGLSRGDGERVSYLAKPATHIGENADIR